MSGPGVSLVLARQVEMRDLVSRDHRVLGELALYFARVYNGVIDFDGALIPASTLSEDERAMSPIPSSWRRGYPIQIST